MSAVAYQPRTDFIAKLRRRSARYLSCDTVRPQLSRGMVSLSFDDCPLSAFETALPMVEAKGWRATIYAAIGLCGTTNHLGLHMSEEDMIAAHTRGHEIGDHTFSHIDALVSGANAVTADIALNRDAFARLGLPRAKTFAYPYGEVTPAVKRTLAPEFELLRGIHAPANDQLDLRLTASARLYSSEIDTTLSLIETAAKDRRWLILFGHDVRENPSDFGCTPSELATVLNTIEQSDLDVLPVRDALEQVRS